MLTRYNRKYIHSMPKLRYPQRRNFGSNMVEEIIDIPKPEPEQLKSPKQKPVKPISTVVENTVVEE